MKKGQMILGAILSATTMLLTLTACSYNTRQEYVVSKVIEKISYDVEYSEDGIILTHYHANYDVKDVKIPSFYEGGSVVGITNCFWYHNEIKSVTIPDSVKEIGFQAFVGCSGLTSITIPNSVTVIGGRAFADCSGLNTVTIPDSVKKIGYYAFIGCTAEITYKGKTYFPSTYIDLYNAAKGF